MADILAIKKGQKKYFSAQDWKTGIPAKDGYQILQGDFEITTERANVSPSKLKPTIIIQQPKGAEVVDGGKADGEEGLAKMEVNEGGLKEKESKPEPKSKELTVIEAVKIIESMTDLQEVKRFVEDDNRLTIIAAFAKKNKTV